MFQVFIVIQILLTLALVGLILVQRNDSDGLGSMGGGGGGGNAFMTGRGAANFMTRSTAIVATLFMLNSLWLAIQASDMGKAPGIIEQLETIEPTVPLADEDSTGSAIPEPVQAPEPAQETPAIPTP
jgi:preprotein translocase subunit SecG